MTFQPPGLSQKKQIWSTVRVSPGRATRCHESRWASNTVYSIFTSANAKSLTPESQTKPHCSSALTSVCPRGDHISPPSAIMFLVDSRLKHDHCKADLWNLLLVNSHSCKIYREVKLWPTTWHLGPRRNPRDVWSDVVLQLKRDCISSSFACFWQKYQNHFFGKRWNQHSNMSPSPSSMQASLDICFSVKQGQRCCLRFYLFILRVGIFVRCLRADD